MIDFRDALGARIAQEMVAIRKTESSGAAAERFREAVDAPATTLGRFVGTTLSANTDGVNEILDSASARMSR
jgi:hypothetical protein